MAFKGEFSKEKASKARLMCQETLYPDYQLLEQLEAAGPFQAGACFQCRKCTNGCPVTFAMDLYPDEVIRMVILGQRETVLRCRTIWVCAACETCTTRCPNEVKIAELMDCLKQMAVEEGVPCTQPQILTLHEAFLNNVKKWGRFFEATFLPAYILRSGELWRKWKAGTWQDELKLAWQMLYKGRIRLFPRTIKGKKDVRTILTHPKHTENTS
jgi:heterodisulfide reductase subunit C